MTSSILQGIQNPQIADLGGRFRQGTERRETRETEEEQNRLASEIVKNQIGFKFGELAFKGKTPMGAVKLAQALGIPTNDKDRMINAAGTIKYASDLLQGGNDPKSVGTLIGEQAQQLARSGVDITQMTELAGDLMSGDPIRIQAQSDALLQLSNSLSTREGTKPAEQASFEALIKDMPEADQIKAKRVKAGLDPRAVGSAIQTITSENLIDEIAKAEQRMAGAKETGKLGAQLKLTPTIRGAVNLAAGAAKETIDANIKDRGNSLALGVYETAVGSLANALENTETGAFVGFLPAITENQQIAQGAVAAMAPILKQIFRGAGEGTFTDSDQKILLQMIPTRSTLPAARISQLSSIDAIVRAKLAPVVRAEGEPGQSIGGDLNTLTDDDLLNF